MLLLRLQCICKNNTLPLFEMSPLITSYWVAYSVYPAPCWFVPTQLIRDGKVLVSSLQVLYRFLYQTQSIGVARSVVVNSNRIFLMHLSFTNEQEGFKQHVSLKLTNGTKKTQTRNVLTEERLDEIGARLETSLRNFCNNFYRQQVCLCHHDRIKHNCCMCPHNTTVIHTLPGRL